MGKDYLVEGAKLKCISGSGTVELKIPKGRAYISDEKRKAIKTDCVPGENIPSFGKCVMNKKDHICRGCVSLTKEWITLPGNIFFGEEKVNNVNAITMQSFLICAKGGIVYPISSGQKPGIGERKSAGNLPFWKIIGRWLGTNTLIQILAGEPINVNIGNFICEKEDLVIKGIMEMKFRMFYNSMDQTKGGSLGEGWHHNYEMHIRQENRNFAQVCLGDGREIPYRLSTGNTYIPVFGDTGKLVKDKEKLIYRASEGIKYIFDETGRLSVKESKNGNRERFYYNENGQLILVKSSNGGSYTYIYNAEGYLISVCDHAGRKIYFLYRYGKLYQFVNSCGFAYTYSYNENGKLESIKTPMGIQSVKNTYDSANRVIKQELPDGGIIELIYNNGCTYMREQNRNIMIYESDECLRNVRTVYNDGEEIFNYNDRNQRTLFVDKNGNQTRYFYDGKGNMTEIRDALGRQRIFTYDAEGHLLTESIEGRIQRVNTYDKKGCLVKTEDALGRSREILYNEKGQPIQIIQSDKSCMYISYDEKGNVISTKDSYGMKVRYEYDDLNRVKKVINEEGNRIQYEYDEKDQLITIIHPDGNIKRYIYNERGKPIQIQDFDGGILNIEYNIMGMPEKIQDKEGRETKRKYDTMGNLQKMIFPTGMVYSYQYDKNNRMIQMEITKDEDTEKPESVYMYAYDSVGNLLHVSAGNGRETLSEIFYEYDELNRVKAVINTIGGKTCYEYDRVTGKLCCITDPIGNRQTFCYNDAGELTEHMDIRGNITRYEYNTLGKLCTVTDGGGRVTKHFYLPGGRLEKSIYPTGKEITYAYDRLGRISSKTYGRYSISYAYDEMGRLILVTNSEGQKKFYSYDALGQITSMTDALDNTIRYSYTCSGMLKEVVDALGNKTEYIYDEMDMLVRVCQHGKIGEVNRVEDYIRNVFGQIECVRDALGAEETYKYDALGRVIKKVDREGFQTAYAYWPDGRIRNVIYGNGNWAEFDYTPLGHLSRIKDWMGETNFERNRQGQPERITDKNGKTISYRWGKFGERVEMIYPDGTNLHYYYDNMMRLTRLEKCEKERSVLCITYGYDQENRLIWKRNSGGYCTKWSYNDLGQISELVHEDSREIIDRYMYKYDYSGNKTSIFKERRGLPEESGSYSYFYDNLGSLTKVEKDGILLRTYQYDSFGNRTEMKDYEQDLQNIYSYDLLNRLREEEIILRNGRIKKSYNYDRRGNMIGEYQEDELCYGYQFGALNCLEKAWDNTGREALYFYNALGQRMGRKSGNVEENYLLDFTKRCRNLLEISTDEKKQKFYWDNNVVVMEEENRPLHYYLQDELGSPLRVLHKTGNGESYGYDEFGRELYRFDKGNLFGKRYTSTLNTK